MPWSVPWRVQKIEASIAEEVESKELSNFETSVKFDLSHLVTTGVLSVPFSLSIRCNSRKIRIQQRRILSRWKPRHETLFKRRSHNYLRAAGEQAGIPNVIPMEMAPDQTTNALIIHASFLENLIDVLLDPQAGGLVFYIVEEGTGPFPPVRRIISMCLPI